MSRQCTQQCVLRCRGAGPAALPTKSCRAAVSVYRISIAPAACTAVHVCGYGHLLTGVRVRRRQGAQRTAVPCVPPCRHAALAACSCCPLSRLGLEGAVPITGSTAEAVSTCCPHVTSLTLDHERYGGALNKYVVHSHALVEYQYGCIELLTHCGPRLTHLRLWVMDRWPALLYKYVARCTALTSLELTQRRGYSYGSTHSGCHAPLGPGF